MPTLKQQCFWLGLILIILTLICLPRFNRADISIIGDYTTLSPEIEQDSDYYLNYVHYFRGQADFSTVSQPFSYRPLIPYIAAQMPFSAMTSINLINILMMQVGLIFLYLLMRSMGISFYGSIAGCLVHTISFPTFYYSTIGYLDPSLLCIITLSLYCLIKGYTGLFFLLFALGVFCKDVIVVLIPVFLVYHFVKKEWSLIQTLALTALLVILWVAGVSLTSKYFSGGNFEFQRVFSIDIIMENLSRSRALLSFLLTFSLPGFLSVWYFFRHFNEIIKDPILSSFFIGFAAVGSTALYALAGAYSDGRYIWIAYPCCIPFALYFLDRYLLSKGVYSQNTA